MGSQMLNGDMLDRFGDEGIAMAITLSEELASFDQQVVGVDESAFF